MTYLNALLTKPASFSAREREQILANISKLVTQPRHKLYKSALQVHAALCAAEQLLPPAQDLVRAGAIDWERTGTRNVRFRGFTDGVLVAVVVRESHTKYRVELGDTLLPGVHSTMSTARAAASIAVPTIQPNHQAA